RVCQQFPLESNHDIGGLYGLRSAFYLEIGMRLWDVQFFKKSVAEVFVIVLSGVDQTVAYIGTLPGFGLDGSDQRGDFHKVGPCARNQCQFHFISDMNCFSLPLLPRSMASFRIKLKWIPGSRNCHKTCLILSISAVVSGLRLVYSMSNVSVLVCLIANSRTFPSSSKSAFVME